jgi:hypothetical protein
MAAAAVTVIDADADSTVAVAVAITIAVVVRTTAMTIGIVDVDSAPGDEKRSAQAEQYEDPPEHGDRLRLGEFGDPALRACGAICAQRAGTLSSERVDTQ